MCYCSLTLVILLFLYSESCYSINGYPIISFSELRLSAHGDDDDKNTRTVTHQYCDTHITTDGVGASSLNDFFKIASQITQVYNYGDQV